jgi:glucose-1-phosphate adenylyltransferase
VTDKDDNITDFQEKPKKPISNLASMGIYIFTYKTLRAELIADAKDPNSEHDFGKNIIPTMMKEKKRWWLIPTMATGKTLARLLHCTKPIWTF